MNEMGIVVGCDARQQWLLPWWWKHYSSHNTYPVVFVDFGMSKEGIAWCKERGVYMPLSFSQGTSLKTSLGNNISLEKKAAFEFRYGVGIWDVRAAWLKKAFALLQFPYNFGLWLDLDCQVRENIEPIFHSLNFGVEMALVRDRAQTLDFLLPGEVNYNSGVIAFQKGAKILQQWVETTAKFEGELPGDQEILSRAIFIHKPSLLELPTIYNWYHAWGPNEKAVIHHFCGGAGKKKLLESMDMEESIKCSLLNP